MTEREQIDADIRTTIDRCVSAGAELMRGEVLSLLLCYRPVAPAVIESVMGQVQLIKVS